MTQPLAAAPPPSHDLAPLAPPWAPIATAVATLITAVLSRLVWHSTQRPVLDGWVLHELGAHSVAQFRLATEVSTGLKAVTVGGIVVTSVVAWMLLRRWNAVVLALTAPLITLTIEKLLKPLVARRVPASTVFHYPSGHVAVATALALSLVLIVRCSEVRPRVRTAVVLATSLFVLLMTWARLVETAHLFSDVIGGAATGVAVTLAAALVLDSRRSGRMPGRT